MNIRNPKPETVANALICLVHQTNFLLDKLLRKLEQQFIKQGGYTEKLYRTRVRARRRT